MKINFLKKICVAIAICVVAPLGAQIIVVDGSDADWSGVPILSEPGVFPYVKVHDSSWAQPEDGNEDDPIVEPPIEDPAPMQNVNYVADNSTIFPNPERGFYHHIGNHLKASGNSTSISNSDLQNHRALGVSLILSIYYLDPFKTSEISQNALQQITNDMQILRNNGMKCILRFAYTDNSSGSDASLSRMKAHLDQLMPVFANNADVICVFQAGFIGAWGEWYYSSNLGTPPSASDRNALLDKYLEVLPASRMLQVRTPQHKFDYIGNQTPLNDATAFKNTSQARIGHHNDCFLASKTDQGTYSSKNIAAEKQYLSEDCLYVPIGGETCVPEGVDPANCTQAQNELRNLRFSYLNMDYYDGVLNGWSGCMDNIKREMGYRFQLISGSFSTKVKRGSTLAVNFSLTNKGYAPVFNARPVQIVLKNTATNQVYTFALQANPRFWKPLATQNITENITIPNTVPAGNYKLYLNLPDAFASLANNANYSIRLANQNMWEEATGYNDLKAQIVVE